MHLNLTPIVSNNILQKNGIYLKRYFVDITPRNKKGIPKIIKVHAEREYSVRLIIISKIFMAELLGYH